MVRHDPYDTDADATQYECRDCLHRVTAEEHTAVCPECDGPLRNVAVPRE